jgi:hypothetical protein
MHMQRGSFDCRETISFYAAIAKAYYVNQLCGSVDSTLCIGKVLLWIMQTVFFIAMKYDIRPKS